MKNKTIYILTMSIILIAISPSLFASAKKDIATDFNSAEGTALATVDNSLSDEAEEFKSAFEIPLENAKAFIDAVKEYKA